MYRTRIFGSLFCFVLVLGFLVEGNAAPIDVASGGADAFEQQVEPLDFTPEEQARAWRSRSGYDGYPWNYCTTYLGGDDAVSNQSQCVDWCAYFHANNEGQWCTCEPATCDDP